MTRTSVTKCGMNAELKDSRTRFMILLTSESVARLSVPCSQGGLPYQVVGEGLGHKICP